MNDKRFKVCGLCGAVTIKGSIEWIQVRMATTRDYIPIMVFCANLARLWLQSKETIALKGHKVQSP